MKPVGIYREMFRKVRDELPVLRASGTSQPIEDRGLVAGYMKAGTPIFDVPGDVTDLIDPAKSIRSGPSLVSDGVWIWRVDSIHYLENYSVQIPAEFLDHVRGRNYQPSSDVDVADPRFDAAIAAYF
ncbi:hypothetical protein D7D52_25295 [Nocardia yunnanensis]|uniref:Uncharacterized protein n=1 Tax=Nocardia yunnanensis TaxID=2382165 RepID=A0A386ZGD0_9NOCA|nr:hypothetical protein D7D52_25295 [Nocardia yunnanensis]